MDAKRGRGFTLIELLVVLTIIAILLTLASPRYFGGVEKAKEAVLKQNLTSLRDALDKYYSDHDRYPDRLEDLVSNHMLRTLPVDPVTESTATWLLVAPEPPLTGGIADVHSGASGTARDGSAYGDW